MKKYSYIILIYTAMDELYYFQSTMSTILIDNNINYDISGVALLNKIKKTIYSVSLIYKTGSWPDASLNNLPKLISLSQSLKIEGFKYIDTFVLDFISNGKKESRLQIWFIKN